MLRIFRFKMESDCFENGLEFFRNLSGARYCVPKSKDIIVKIPQLEEEQLTKIQNVLGAIFSSHSRQCCFHSTIKKKLIFRSNNQTITQISNLIFLITQTLYLPPVFSSVFQCPLGETLIREASTGSALLLKVFLRIPQNLPEITCVRVSFSIKLQA